MVCMTVGIYMAVLYYHVIRMNISTFRVIHYILHSYVRVFSSLSKPLSCFPRMVNTRNNPAALEQAEGSGARDANLPHPPSLAEVMLVGFRVPADP